MLSRGMRKTLPCLALFLAPICIACSDNDTPDPDAVVAEAGADLTVEGMAGDRGSLDAGPEASVDSLVPDAPVPDMLTYDSALTPEHRWCAKPKKLTFSGGKASISDTTAGASDQWPKLGCGNANGPWAGNQLYYRVTLNAAKAYRVTLTPAKGYDAALYAFAAKTACKAAAVNGACAGFDSDVIGAGKVERLTFSPASSGDWVVAVDGHVKGAGGAFTLEVAEHTPPAHSACAKAAELKLTAGKGSVTGDTASAINENGSKVACGGYTYMTGPQLYYEVALTAKQAYKLTLSPSFYGYLYVFPFNGCGSVASINTACGTSGQGVLAGPVGAGTSGSVVFTPGTSGTYVVAVDSAAGSSAGAFSLSVATFATAKNGACSKAQAIKLSGGKVTVSGDTTGVKNEHSAVKCGGPHALNGSQVYYKVSLTAKKAYRVALTPASHAGHVSIFPGGSCTKDGKKIEAACGSLGKTGAVAGPINPGKTGALHFTPATSGDFIVAIDSLGGGQSGPFSLEVSEFALKAPTTFTAPLSWDFDSDCQKLGATGDWQCGGSYAFDAKHVSCDVPTGTEAPKAPHSGGGMWGTVLNGCHSPSGNAQTPCANVDPYDDSVLHFAVTLPATWKKAALTYWSWDDYFLPYDWSEVRVDGKALSQSCKGPRATPVVWTKRTVDLSAYVGKTVTVSLHFSASTTVSYSGWYVDDLAISGQ